MRPKPKLRQQTIETDHRALWAAREPVEEAFPSVPKRPTCQPAEL
jgi:hypothetical protein